MKGTTKLRYKILFFKEGNLQLIRGKVSWLYATKILTTLGYKFDEEANLWIKKSRPFLTATVVGENGIPF